MKKSIVITMIALLVLGFLIYFFSTLRSEMSHDMNHENHAAMINTERDFLEHMIPHHMEAVDTATIVQEKGGNLRPIRDLVESIKVSQTAEIELMKGWYLSWYGTPYQDTGVYTPMMRSLGDLSGTELDRVFLEDMIVHHEMAVSVSKKVLELKTNPETAALATKIIAAQEKEIYLMKDLLKLFP
jgi:uncharacterized protein (DUF305 family)